MYIFLVVVISCNGTPQTEEIDFPTAEELQSQSADIISLKRKRDIDIIEYLYGEALKRDPKLESLENRISGIDELLVDSLKSYEAYVNYNKRYHQSAHNYINSIEDSAKRNLITSIFDDSRKRFQKNISKHNDLFTDAHMLGRELKDQHIMMKLMISENLINAYFEDRPSIEPLVSLNDQIKNLITESEQYFEQNRNQ